MSQRCYSSAIVGTGGIAGAHAQAIRDAGDRARLVAAVDVDGARAGAFADAWQVPATYPSLDALLAADPTIDLVHVCTPPGSHAGLAEHCLAAGVTVLMEKPPAVSLNELRRLAAAERDSTGTVATVFQHRFGPAAVRLRRLAAGGVLGRPLLATCVTAWYRDDAYFAVPWRGTWESEGGGPTMGHGIHQFDLMLSVLGPWREVTAVAARQARDTETEDVSMALVTFASGAVASVTNSVLSPRQTSTLRFDYQHATVEVEHLYGYTDDDWTLTPAPGSEPVAAAWSSPTGPAGVVGLTGVSGAVDVAGPAGVAGPVGVAGAARSAARAGRPADARSGHGDQFAAVLDALDRGQAPPVTLADTWQTMEFVAALYASAFTGERVTAGQLGPDHPFSHRMDGNGAPWLGNRATR